jgi:hypothetical protein
MRILWPLGQILIVGMRFELEVGITSPALMIREYLFVLDFFFNDSKLRVFKENYC